MCTRSNVIGGLNCCHSDFFPLANSFLKQIFTSGVNITRMIANTRAKPKALESFILDLVSLLLLLLRTVWAETGEAGMVSCLGESLRCSGFWGLPRLVIRRAALAGTLWQLWHPHLLFHSRQSLSSNKMEHLWRKYLTFGIMWSRKYLMAPPLCWWSHPKL